MKALIFFVTMLFANVVFAQTFQSSNQQVPLIELYTSEGCSSCPPADRWMTGLLEQEGLWQSFVPIALHVDYWDYIGWADPFASKEYSQRQRRYAAEFHEPTVYTPGMRKSGEVWRNWIYTNDPVIEDAENVGVLNLDVTPDGQFNASFETSDEVTGSRQINIAVLGLGLSSEVTRGENRGKKLEHNFVVLGLSTFGSAKANEWQGSLPSPSVSAPRYAVAAWVTQGGSLKPVQVVGGELDLAVLH